MVPPKACDPRPDTEGSRGDEPTTHHTAIAQKAYDLDGAAAPSLVARTRGPHGRTSGGPLRRSSWCPPRCGAPVVLVPASIRARVGAAAAPVRHALGEIARGDL
ncbi:hypothetical protein GCM10018785_41990 [Streptomyces longispororuber]|uniref:Uncharacterized protein n=1 Tax=Streptomyces longispororuber TaxID=68230 RepID=A0A918ZT44_9ACTN|nr:hypothetical protein [Streptomyces longispororuber]GHE69050.1 hypothetical protein GCM10018785_41990 [Streptomyces longispororuber]